MEVVTSSGRKVPGVEVDLSATGAEVAERVTTGSSGTVKTTVKAPAAGTLSVEARAASLPAALPTLYAPTRGESARNAQRIVAAQTSRRACAVQAAGAGAAADRHADLRSRSTSPGAKLTDTVRVTGLGGQAATIQAALYGPVPGARGDQRARTRRSGPARSRSPGDGEYVTEPVTLDTPGYYTYRESIAESETIAGGPDRVRGGRGDDDRARRAEDHDPDQRAGVHARRADHRLRPRQRARQAGRDGQRRAVGPVPVARGDDLRGHAVLDRHVPGDRRRHLHHRAGRRSTQAGYYTYRESIAATEAYDAVVTPCGEVSETTLAKAAPKVTTVVSDAVVKPDAEIFDRLTVSGLGKTPATVERRALRPVRLARGHRLRGRAVLEGQGRGHRRRRVLLAEGDRPARRLLRLPRADRRLGVRRRRTRPSARSRPRPRCRRRRSSAGAATGSPTSAQGSGGPSRVRLGRLRIDAAVSAIGIDLKSGALGIPENIRRVGWWRDGASPGRRERHRADRRPRRQREEGRGRVLRAQERPPRRHGDGALGREDAALPRDVDAADAQGGAAVEHLHAHRRRRSSCSSPAAARSTPAPATTGTTSSSRRRPCRCLFSSIAAGRRRSIRAPTWRRRRSSAVTCGSGRTRGSCSARC